jgi:hypothetical protein
MLLWLSVSKQCQAPAGGGFPKSRQEIGGVGFEARTKLLGRDGDWAGLCGIERVKCRLAST